MLSRALQSILRRYFGQFITGLQNVQLTFWTGKINIQEASFKHEKINEMLKMHGIPLTITHSFLGELQIDIPWKELTSAPVEIKVSNVFIVFQLEKVLGLNPHQQLPTQDPKLILIKNYLAHLLKRSEEGKSEQQSEAGFVRKLLVRVLHNLNLEIGNIHIRIENRNNSIVQQAEAQDEFVDCQDEETDLGFSLGLCIEGIEVGTIDANNQKVFVKVESEKTHVRKQVGLRQISVYWEQSSAANLLELGQEGKLHFLRGVIGRKEHRLLTIDGQVLMERARDSFDYFFSTSFRLLEVAAHYGQLRQFIELYQQIANVKARTKITKLRELDHAQQLALEPNFKALLNRLQPNNFATAEAEDVVLLQGLDRKLLMRWTKEEAAESIRRAKLRQAFESKNKRAWLGFFSKNTQNELSREEVEMVEREVEEFMATIEEESLGKTLGLYLHFHLLCLSINHPAARQQLRFTANNIELQFETKKGAITAGIEIADVGLAYLDTAKQAKVSIIQSLQAETGKYFKLRLENSKALQRLEVGIDAMRITHEIQFLSFLAQMVKLREREKFKAQMQYFPELTSKKQQQQQPAATKDYEWKIAMGRLDIHAEMSSSASLHAYIQGIAIDPAGRNSHNAQLRGVGIAYLQGENSYKLLEEVSVEVGLRGLLAVVESTIPELRLTVNEQSVYYIIRCLRDQYDVLQIRAVERASAGEGEERVMEGEASTIGVFKAVSLYHCVLTPENLYFYEKSAGKVNYSRVAKKILLRNVKVARLDALSFKLESAFVNEIVRCGEEAEADRWVYHVEQRIFENSSRMQVFSMMEEEGEGPLIYIPYQTRIRISLARLTLLYEKDTAHQILALHLRHLTLTLDENNTHFQRLVHLEDLQLRNLTHSHRARPDEYALILSNTHNYFEDPGEDDQPQPKIAVVIEGKKKTHPKYTGEVTIKAKINKLFVNYDAEFVFGILYRLAVGEAKEQYLSEEEKFRRIFEMLREIQEQGREIEERYEGAKDFEFNRSYVELEHYRALYACAVLFHVELECEEVEVFLINGKGPHWMHKFNADRVSIEIDKSTDFLFIKGAAGTVALADVTGYPHTTSLPFHQLPPYPILQPLAPGARQHRKMVQFSAGVFEPMAFINRQRFKNYFWLSLQDAEFNYQQQPLLRFVDFLTHQIILFVLEPFSLHRFDTPNRGAFHFAPLNFTQEEVRKMLYESVYPTFTHLNFAAHNLTIHFNSHPHDQEIPFTLAHLAFASLPEPNAQRIHVRRDELQRFESRFPGLRGLSEDGWLERRVSKWQWVTRYLITAQGLRGGVIENDFNYEMYFERSNNGDKDLLLPFLRIEKDLLMEGRIKRLSILAPREAYNLINKCFIFNLAYDDQADSRYNANHDFGHLAPPSKLIYRLLLAELAVVIPEVNQTVLIVQNCEYKFLRHEDGRKEMEVNGRSLHILGEQDVMTPLDVEGQERGLEYAIVMFPSGEKRMTASIRQVNFHYHQHIILPLFRYFLLDESCYPKQDVYGDLPLIVCEVNLLNSYVKLLESEEHVYAVKGDFKVVWSRYQQPHPENYRENKALFPKDKDGSSYDIELKGVTLRKYSRKAFLNLTTISAKETNFYRSLSSSIVLAITLTNVMRLHNGVTYSDTLGLYHVDSLCLKLSYKDYQEITASFQSKPEEAPAPPPPELPYTPHSKHKATINKLSLQFGLSELPVPLLDVCLQRSQVDVEVMGRTRVLTSKVEVVVGYWNMLIGRWEPLMERAGVELTMKAGGLEKYLMVTSGKPILVNLSVEALKVVTLVSRDVAAQGSLHVLNREERAKGTQISPYVVANRTGLSLIVHSDFTLTAKLRSNDRMHLQHRSAELSETFSAVTYQIEGDSALYTLNLNLNQTQRPTVTYNSNPYRLIVSAHATPVLKEIVISSPYQLYNRTPHLLLLTLGQREYRVDPEGKLPVPFTEEMSEGKTVRVEFPHLEGVVENYSFELRDVARGYEHYIVYGAGETFNCLVSLEVQNESVITVGALVSLRNLLPVDAQLEVAVGAGGAKGVLKQAVEVNGHQEFYEFGSKDEVQLRIHVRGFNYSAFTPLDLTSSRQLTELAIDLPLVDCRGLQAVLRLRITKKHRRKYIYLYADSVLLNETNNQLYVFDDAQLLAGQRLKDIPESYSKYVFLGAPLKPSLCFSEEDPSMGCRFKMRELVDQVLSVNHHEQLHELVACASLNCLNEEAQIFTSFVKITPRFVLLNLTTRSLAFQQYNTDQRFLLPVRERKNWYWHHNEEARLITVTARESDIEVPEGWDYSAPFSLEGLEETVLVIRPMGRSAERLLLKTEVMKEGQQVFISFKELLEKEDSLIRIQNNLKLVNLEVQQEALLHSNAAWAVHRHFPCPSLKEIDFGWDLLQEDRRIHITFNFVGPYRSRYDSDTLVLAPDELDKPITKHFRGDNDETLSVEISVEIVGLRRTVILSNRDESQVSQCDDEVMLSMSGNKMGVSLSEIGVSIIGGQGRRSELVFMSVRKLDLIMTEKQQRRNFELRIKYVNVDNNLNHNTVYPVLFTPLKYHKTMDKARPFFICLLEQNLKTKQLTEINYFRLCIEPISFKIYDEMVTHLYNYSQALASISDSEQQLDVGTLFRSREAEFEWQKRAVAKEGASVFLREVEIGKVVVELSFSIRPTFKGNIILHTVLALFGSAFTNVSESQMRLSRLLRRNLSLGEMKGQLGGFYQREVMKEMYKIAGSINLFGNPYVFIKYLAEGTWEIVNQPSEGFIKGPIEGAIGIGRGGVYFLRNVVAATFNSFEAVSESCSRGMAYITFDQKFITRRDKIQMQKSKHIVQGTKSAAWALYTGFEVAISGIVRHPREESRKSGTGGLFKGLALGLAGLVTKPMSGIFEAISKFSQGVKQTALFFQDGPNATRSRPPRVFISSQQYYSQYNLQQSKAINLLQFHSTKHLEATVLLVAVDQDPSDITYTVVTSDYLVQLSKTHKKIIREIKLADINEVEPEEDAGRRGVRIRFGEHHDALILTHKHRELYDCFREIFTQIDQEMEEEELDDEID